MSIAEMGVGSPALEFKLLPNTGGGIALSDYRGKMVFLFFVREYNCYNAARTSPSWGA